MSLLTRSLLALLMALSLIGATVSDVSAALPAEIAAATDACCEGGCRADPACGAACAMMVQGGIAILSPLQALAFTVAEREIVARLSIPDQQQPSGLSPDGLTRPPRI